MGRTVAILMIIAGAGLLVAARFLFPMVDADLMPQEARDYFRVTAGLLCGVVGLVALLIGAKRAVSPKTELQQTTPTAPSTPRASISP